MNVLIPIGGLGERFTKEGYTSPKPLINILGKCMLQYVIDNLKSFCEEEDNLIIVYNKFLTEFSFEEKVNQFSKHKIYFIEIPYQTKGAAETVLYGLENLPNNIIHKPIMLLDCDNFYTVDIIKLYKESQNKNVVFNFEDKYDKPIYSYVLLKNNKIIDIQEKIKISDYANTGCYCFSNGSILKIFCEHIINNNITFNNEYYISCVIKYMLTQQIEINSICINKEDFYCLGTPMHIKMFASSYKKFDKLRICFDLDNCLVKTENNYMTTIPIQKNINYCNFLKSLGHTIIIHTARRMKTHNGNQGKLLKEIGMLTLQQLEDYNINYDEIYFGKPYAHYYIDDLAINSYNNLQKELGFYMSAIQERSFNNIEFNTIDIVTKKSKDLKKLNAEIYWYKNIPNEIKNLFPKLYDYGKDFYSIEFIHGLTFSYLYSNELLTPQIFQLMLNELNKIHKNKNIIELKKNNIYLNYATKLKNRYLNNKNFYEKFNNNKEDYKTIIKFLEDYENKNCGNCTMIHGDPVFTNIIFDKENNIKFVDMRGLLGETESVYGDMYYDYSKIYQSLIGYDEIILNKEVNNSYRNIMLQSFEEKIGKQLFNNCKMITNSLIFSMLPLHQEDLVKCKKFYKLISFK